MPVQPQMILLVDDEPSVLSIVALILSQEGFQVITANGAAEALKLADGAAREAGLLLTDVSMPVMDGAALAQLLVQKNPALRVLFMTGYAAPEIFEDGIPHAAGVIRKPFGARDLAERVQTALS